MKSFKSYISEEVLPTVNVENGNFDVENEAVRSQINGTLAAVTAQPAVTPYVLLRKVSKALSYFHIILPKRTFLEGNKGVEVYEVMQFGDRMGMTDQGEFVHSVPTKFYLFFQYGISHPFNVTYTKPNIDGMYRGMAKIVDQVELDRLLNAAEAMMAEACAYDDKATESQRHAGREEIQTNADHGSPSTKKAMDTSDEKSAKVDKVWPAVVKEAMSRKQKDMAVRRFMSHDPDAGERILAMGKKEREEKKSFASAKKEIKRLKEEEQIDELKKSTLGSYIKKAHVSGLEAASKGEIAYARKDKEGLRAANKTGEKREQGIERAANKLSMKESRMPASVIAHKQKLASMSPDELKKKFAGKSEEHLKSMARRHGYGKDSDVYSKHIKEDNLEEGMAPINKSYAMRKMKKKVSTTVKQGLGVGKEKTSTILVTNKGDPKASGGGGVHRIPKDKYDPSKHNLASE